MPIQPFLDVVPLYLLPQVLDHVGSSHDRRLAAAAHLEAALVAHTYREPQAAADSLSAASSALGVDIQVAGEGPALQHCKLCPWSMSSYVEGEGRALQRGKLCPLELLFG